MLPSSKAADAGGRSGKSNADSEAITDQLVTMMKIGPATPELRDKASAAIAAMNTPIGQMLMERNASIAKLREKLEGKPLTIAAVQNNYRPFTMPTGKAK